MTVTPLPVYYTHLDVYKRQGSYRFGDSLFFMTWEHEKILFSSTGLTFQAGCF